VKLAERMSRLGTETAFEVLARARALEAQGRHVVHLEIGEPDFSTPAHIVAAAVDALRAGETHYTPAAGISPLREAIARHITTSRGIDARAEHVVVTPGAKPIMFFAMLALAGPGDDVIYPNPGFPIYQSMINFVGATPVPLPLREERDFRFDAAEFRSLISDRTRLIILNSPQNPTGGVLTHDDLEVVADAALARGIMVLSDEVYEQILYTGEHVSIASLPGMQERTILLDGFSKTYAMTGWRLGYGVMPVEVAEQVARLMVNSNSCTAAFTQHAGIAALTGRQDDVRAMVRAFEERRSVIVDSLRQIPGVRCVMPAGAFYAFPNVQDTGVGSEELARRLLDDAGVAVLPGNSFGAYGDGYLRLSYANSVDNIRAALDRMDALIRSLA
jgi:aspartate aminotransferase